MKRPRKVLGDVITGWKVVPVSLLLTLRGDHSRSRSDLHCLLWLRMTRVRDLVHFGRHSMAFQRLLRRPMHIVGETGWASGGMFYDASTGWREPDSSSLSTSSSYREGAALSKSLDAQFDGGERQQTLLADAVYSSWKHIKNHDPERKVLSPWLGRSTFRRRQLAGLERPFSGMTAPT